MTNPISKVYNLVDDGLMYFANKAVQGYNYTFGGTKADLANLFNTAGTSLTSLGIIGANPPSGTIGASMLIPLLFMVNKYFKEMERKEVNAIQKEVMDLDVKHFKDALELGGYIMAADSAFAYIGLTNCSRVSYSDTLLTSIGIACLSAGAQIMRADYLPPKKSIFRIAGEKLVDMVKNFEPPVIDIPNPVPQPVPVRVR